MKKLLALVMAMFLSATFGCALLESSIAGLSPAKIETEIVTPEGCLGNVCKEAGYEIAFAPVSASSDGIGFTIKNTGADPISVLWDECAYVGIDGQSSRVMHSGIRYMERDAPQAPSMIAPGSMLTDEMTPTANVYFISGEYGGWRVKPLFGYVPAEQINGRKAGIYLTLKIGETKKAQQYLFSIKATAPNPDATPASSTPEVSGSEPTTPL